MVQCLCTQSSHQSPTIWGMEKALLSTERPSQSDQKLCPRLPLLRAWLCHPRPGTNSRARRLRSQSLLKNSAERGPREATIPLCTWGRGPRSLFSRPLGLPHLGGAEPAAMRETSRCGPGQNLLWEQRGTPRPQLVSHGPPVSSVSPQRTLRTWPCCLTSRRHGLVPVSPS